MLAQPLVITLIWPSLFALVSNRRPFFSHPTRPSCGAPMHGVYHRGYARYHPPYKSTPGDEFSKINKLSPGCVHVCPFHCTLAAILTTFSSARTIACRAFPRVVIMLSYRFYDEKGITSISRRRIGSTHIVKTSLVGEYFTLPHTAKKEMT